MTHGLILAAGKGTRMNSSLAKPLHLLGKKKLVQWVLENAQSVCEDIAIVVGHHAEAIKDTLGGSYEYIEQKEQRGTGDAVVSAMPYLQSKKDGTLLVLAADQPLISTKTMREVLETHTDSHAKMTLATVIVPDFENEFAGFFNYGRVIRNEKNEITSIVEYKECTDVEKKILEVNISCIAFEIPWLLENIGKIQVHPQTREFYLMDLLPMALAQNQIVASYTVSDTHEGIGINTPQELVLAETYVQTT